MITHKMKLSCEPFEKIVSGKKIIESRLFDEKRQIINTGDEIEFSQSDDETRKVLTKVKALHKYKTFSDLCTAFPAENFGGISSELLLEEIRRFYSKEEEEAFGVVGIQIELCSGELYE